MSLLLVRRRTRRARRLARLEPSPLDRALARVLDAGSAITLGAALVLVFSLGAQDMASLGAWSWFLGFIAILYWMRGVLGVLAARAFDAEVSPLGWASVAMSGALLLAAVIAWGTGGGMIWDRGAGDWTWMLLSDPRAR